MFTEHTETAQADQRASQESTAVKYTFGGESTHYAPPVETKPEPEPPTEEVPAAEVPAGTEEVTPPAPETTPEPTAEEKPAATDAKPEAEAGEPKPEVPASNVVVSSNFYKKEAANLVELGELPADFDINKENLSAEDITTAWRQNKAPQVYQTLQTQFNQQLNQLGLDDPKILQTAFLIKNGVSVEDAEYLADYEDLSSKEIETLDQEEALSYLKTYFEDSDMSELIQKTSLEKAEKDIDFRDNLVKTAHKHFVDRKTTLQNEATTLAQNNLAATQEFERNKVQYLNGIFSTKTINGNTMDPVSYSKFVQGMQVKNVPVTTANGQTVNVTAFDQFQELIKTRYDVVLQLFYNTINAQPTTPTQAPSPTQVVWTDEPVVAAPKAKAKKPKQTPQEDTKVVYTYT